MGTHKWRHLVCFIWEIPGYPEVSSFPALFWNLLHKSGSLTIHPQSSHDLNNLENHSHTQRLLWTDISAKRECCWLASLWASDLTCFTSFLSPTSQNCPTTTGIDCILFRLNLIKSAQADLSLFYLGIWSPILMKLTTRKIYQGLHWTKAKDLGCRNLQGCKEIQKRYLSAIISLASSWLLQPRSRNCIIYVHARMHMHAHTYVHSIVLASLSPCSKHFSGKQHH